MNHKPSLQQLISGMLFSAALLVSPFAIAADNSAQEMDEIEQALALGTDIPSADCDKRLRAELEAALRRNNPIELAHFEALEKQERLEILDVYRDSGYLPAVVSAMGTMPGPIE